MREESQGEENHRKRKKHKHRSLDEASGNAQSKQKRHRARETRVTSDSATRKSKRASSKPIRKSERARNEEKRKGQQPAVSVSQKQMQPAPSQVKKVGYLVLNVLYYIITIGMIVIALVFGLSAMTGNKSAIMGYRFFTVLTPSMATPEGVKIEGPKGFDAQSVVVVKDAKIDQLKVGDIVTYRIGPDGDVFLTHRLVKKYPPTKGQKEPMIMTKGDANESKDPPVAAERIVGKVVFSVPKVGYLLEFIRKNFWLSLIFVLSLFGSILVLKSYFFNELTEEAQKE